jgi:hypothetical protein
VTLDGAKVVGAALLLALVIPALGFAVLRRRVSEFDAAAIAATYGSVSAVTFVAATQFVADKGDEAAGYLTVALVVMESPAIVMAVLLASWAPARATRGAAEVAPAAVSTGASVPAGEQEPALVTAGSAGSTSSIEVPTGAHADGRTVDEQLRSNDALEPMGDAPVVAEPTTLKGVLHEAFTDGAHLLLIGSLVIGAVSGAEGGEAMQPFVGDIFKGLLALFLLEMGLLVARQLREVRDVGPFLIGFGLVMPLVGASLAALLGSILGLAVGDLTVLMVLAGSASYIVVPAVIRYAIPEARPSRYFTMALGVTFPFNILIGIPLYYAVANQLAS